MAVRLKTKITLGGLFLFTLLLLTGLISFFYLNRVAGDAREIVKDNYETLSYCRHMLREMDQLEGSNRENALHTFDSFLLLQEKNITEPGEKQLTDDLRVHFQHLQTSAATDSVAALVRNELGAVMQLNLDAISQKNQVAQDGAQRAKFIIGSIAAICILLGFTFLFSFPGLVAGPVAKLSEGIRAIAARNYNQRIHLNRNDEFGELATSFNTMAEKLDEYEHSNLATIMFQKKRAESVINTLKDASIGIDAQGTILFANRQALQLLSLKEEAVVGVASSDLEQRNDLFRFLVHQQPASPFRIVLDGKENFFAAEFIDLDESGSRVILLKNITPFKEQDVAKTHFIATISHELKTPLASSDFSLKLLEDERVGPLNTEQKELVESLRDDNRRLLKILSELLDISQAESGKIQLDMQAADAGAILAGARAVVQNLAKQKNITITVRAADTLPVFNADAEKISWVLNNLLTNAIRYSPEGGTITLEAGSQPGVILFAVSDNGPGIEKGYQAKIFDRYFRIPGNRQGTGLGLAISREFIEAHDGSIGVESTPGQGSRFWFSLPVSA